MARAIAARRTWAWWGNRMLVRAKWAALAAVSCPRYCQCRRQGVYEGFRGRLLTHWIVGGEDCPVTFREEQGDLVLDEVVRGGRVAVRTFFANGAGVLLLLGVTLPVGARHETDNEMAEALGTHRSGLDLTVGARGP